MNNKHFACKQAPPPFELVPFIWCLCCISYDF